MAKYNLGLKQLDEDIGGVAGGTNILLTGLPLARKDAIVNRILAAGLGEGDAAILVETRRPAGRVLESLAPAPPGAAIGVVDCVTRTLGINARDTPNVRHATSPMDLTGVGVRIGQFVDDFQGRSPHGIRLGIDSVSTMLMYSNPAAVFRFLHVITGQVMLNGELGIYALDEGMVDEQTMAAIKQLFSAVLQSKIEDDRTYIRALGLTPRPTPWYEYEIEGQAAVLKGGTG